MSLREKVEHFEYETALSTLQRDCDDVIEEDFKEAALMNKVINDYEFKLNLVEKGGHGSSWLR